MLLLVLAGYNPPVTPIYCDLYDSSDDLMEHIHYLVHPHPGKLSIELIKSGNKGYNAEVNVVTYCRGRRQRDDRSNFRILLFLTNKNGATLNSALDKLVIKAIIDNISFFSKRLVPIESSNGRKRVEAGDLCEGRNGNHLLSLDYDPSEENPGSAPFSEPETQIMRKLTIVIALFMSYDHKNTTSEGLLLQNMRNLLENLNKIHCQNRCMVGSSIGLLATYYIYDVVRTPLAFTFEIYGDNQTSSRDCFKMFNLVDLPSLQRVLNDWSAAFLTIFKLGPLQLGENNTKAAEKWVSIDDYLDGYLEVIVIIVLGVQEIKTYFRLFLLSSVLLMFMFCSRIV
ncbi:hypothetical protein N665_0532s0084 [Sinapis alba]|nr:hypothetical protein N665_0532s0084 [Sinapis alba]